MNQDERLATLRKLPELAGVGGAALRGLLPYLDEVTIGAGELLARAGRPCTEFLVVVEGSLEARGGAGTRRLESGQSSGWREMWERGMNRETLVATSRARLLVMGRAQFRAVTALGDRRPETEAGHRSDRAELDLSA